MTRFETRLLLAAMVAWLLAGIVAILVGPPLGYDEAAFASLARGADTPNWRYRSHAVILLAKIGVALGGSELALRVPFLLVGLGLPLAAFALGRAAFDARTGAWAAAVLATSHQLLYRASQVLGDVPSTAALLGALAIVIGEFTRGPTRRLLWAAPCFAAAFYFRYGNAPVVAVAMVAAPFVWWRVARANAGLVLATGGLFAVLLVPHVVQSLHETGSPLGLLTFSAGVPRRAFVGEGLVTYVTANPLLYYGALVAPCMLAGLATLASRRRAPTFLAGVGLAQIASVGLSSHAQPRYVFAGVCILAILGVAVWRRLARPRVAIVMLALAYAWASRWQVRTNTRSIMSRAPYVTAGDLIHEDGDERCIVLATSLPQVLWYSGCEAGRWYYDATRADLSPARRRYLVETAPGKQIDPQWAIEHAFTLEPRHGDRDRCHVWLLR